MTALPTSVIVGPHTYKVVTVPDGILNGAGRVGQTCAMTGVIAIDNEQSRSQMADTVIHELVHAVLNVTDLDNEIEERVCLALGPGLLGVLRDNPALVKWLVKR